MIQNDTRNSRQTKPNMNCHRKESLSLQAILGLSAVSVTSFFDTIWQSECAVFSHDDARSNNTNFLVPNPYRRLIDHGWEALIDLLERARKNQEQQEKRDDQYVDASDVVIPLLFKDQEIVPREQQLVYGDSLFAAFLDGCSVVINHADLQSPFLAALCEDLQHSFPHAYANTYLTPPDSQAVGAHADDRDVLVIQVYGSKEWSVYKRIPVPLPYPHEQVGKDGIAVPDVVLDGPKLINRILRPGDVLYMPRGYVHEARTVDHQPSFHVTVALATHDWSLAGLLTAAGEKIWTNQLTLRRAIHRDFGRLCFDEIPLQERDNLQQQIDEALVDFREMFTIESIHETLKTKYNRHNTRAAAVRQHLVDELDHGPVTVSSAEVAVPVGRNAASRVYLSTVLRLATDQERSSLTVTPQARGLHVRHECYDAIIAILQRIKGDPNLRCSVSQLRSLLTVDVDHDHHRTICNLTLLSFGRQCVELGALAISEI